MNRIVKKCGLLLVVLAAMFFFLPAGSQKVYADDEIPIVGVENILTGLSGGKIVVGRNVTFSYAQLMNLNTELRAVYSGNEDAVVGIRKSTGEEYSLTHLQLPCPGG